MIARPKRQLTGVVVELRLVDPHHFAPRGRIDYVGIAGGNLPLRDHALMVKGVWVRHRKVRRAVYRLARVSVEPAEARAVHLHERRSEEHTSELQSLAYLVCRLLLEKKKDTHRDLYAPPKPRRPPPKPSLRW